VISLPRHVHPFTYAERRLQALILCWKLRSPCAPRMHMPNIPATPSETRGLTHAPLGRSTRSTISDALSRVDARPEYRVCSTCSHNARLIIHATTTLIPYCIWFLYPHLLSHATCKWLHTPRYREKRHDTCHCPCALVLLAGPLLNRFRLAPCDHSRKPDDPATTAPSH